VTLYRHKLIDLVKSLYSAAAAEIRTPVGPTHKFPINAGVIQGDPLSSVLFILVLAVVLQIANVMMQHPAAFRPYVGLPWLEAVALTKCKDEWENHMDHRIEYYVSSFSHRPSTSVFHIVRFHILNFLALIEYCYHTVV